MSAAHPSTSRRPLHRRAFDVQVFAREDGLFDVEASLTDTKSHDVPLAGVPRVYASGQGGLLDVVLDRGFAQNRTIYFCFAEETNGGGYTALARAELKDGSAPSLDNVKLPD